MFDGDNTDREQQLDALVKAGQFPEALLILESWYDREPWNGEVLMRLAVVYWLSGQPARTLRTLDALRAKQPLELAALDLRIAVNAVGEIVGKTATEDLLDAIFSQFCLGK